MKFWNLKNKFDGAGPHKDSLTLTISNSSKVDLKEQFQIQTQQLALLISTYNSNFPNYKFIILKIQLQCHLTNPNYEGQSSNSQKYKRWFQP